MKTGCSLESCLRSRWFEGFALFVIALVPRILGLGIFLTVDESGWLGFHTRHFLRVILSGDWVATYRRYHPAVTLMWMIAVGFTLQYLIQGRMGLIGPISFASFLERIAEPVDPAFLPWGRLPVALMNSVCVVAIYLLLCKLFNRRVALLSAALLNFEPFYLAFSRLALPDALMSSLVCVSLLSFMVYLWQGRRVRYLALSGLTFGLALLTKSPAILLAPVTALLSLVAFCRFRRQPQANRRREGLPLFVALLLWGGIAGVVFFALWPAMWIAPVSTLVRMLDQAAREAAGGWASFFMGRFTTNPPPWFYLVVLLIRTTPLTLAGFIAFLLSLLAGNFNKADLGLAWKGKALALLTYVVIFAAFMAAWANKGDRFLLPVFPPMCILAALGITYWGPMAISQLKLSRWAEARFWLASI
ncbi:MAG TPA: phospholipid carrier-dependent glycosyltransferase, partial [Anaerolineae bacterium]|nr:phospholipid carrier-dependent glycosyltransferase [Anaerolineae bacterium]